MELLGNTEKQNRSPLGWEKGVGIINSIRKHGYSHIQICGPIKKRGGEPKEPIIIIMSTSNMTNFVDENKYLLVKRLTGEESKFIEDYPYRRYPSRTQFSPPFYLLFRSKLKPFSTHSISFIHVAGGVPMYRAETHNENLLMTILDSPVLFLQSHTAKKL